MQSDGFHGFPKMKGRFTDSLSAGKKVKRKKGKCEYREVDGVGGLFMSVAETQDEDPGTRNKGKCSPPKYESSLETSLNASLRGFFEEECVAAVGCDSLAGA